MSINTRLDGSAEMCRAVAVELRVLRDEVSHGCNVLAHARTVAAGAWSGLAAEAFDTEARTKAERADQLLGLIGGLSADLDGLGDVFEAIEAEMARARAVASAAEIPVNGYLIADHGEFTMAPEQEAPLDNVNGIVERARVREAEVQAQWKATLQPVLEFTWEVDLQGMLQGGTTIGTGPKGLLHNPPSLSDVPRPSKEQLLSLAMAPGRLPDLPGGARYPGELGTMKILIDSAEKQAGLDKGRTDLGPTERGLRGALRGTFNLAGGTYAATQVAVAGGPLNIKAIILAEVAGRKAGDKAADVVLGVLDAVL